MRDESSDKKDYVEHEFNFNDIAYGEGQQAYHDGYGLKYNPYKRFTEKWNEWNEWKEGREDEKKNDPYWEKLRE